MYIASQILVSISDIIFIGSMFTKKRLPLVILLFISDVFFAVHFFLLDGGITGAYSVILDIVYLIVTYLLERFDKTKYSLPVSIVAIAAMGAITALTWVGPLSLLPMGAMVSYFVCMIFPNVIVTKVGALLRNIFYIIYMILIADYFGVGWTVAIIIAAIVGIVQSVKIYKTQKQTTQQEKQA